MQNINEETLAKIGNEEMAITGYLGIFIIVLISYPFVLVALQMFVFDIKVRAKVTKWFNIGCGIFALGLIVVHMQTEVIYGKALLEYFESIQ